MTTDMKRKAQLDDLYDISVTRGQKLISLIWLTRCWRDWDVSFHCSVHPDGESTALFTPGMYYHMLLEIYTYMNLLLIPSYVSCDIMYECGYICVRRYPTSPTPGYQGCLMTQNIHHF